MASSSLLPTGDEPPSTDPSSVKNHLYKVIVVGDYAVGKTSLIKRYTEGVFTPNYKLTIGVDFAVKTLLWDDDTRISIQLWDVAGHERFGSMTSVYYKYAIGAVLVFDVSRPATFDAVLKWRDDVNSKISMANGKPIPAILLANKADLPDARIDRDAIDAFAKEHGFLQWFPTSAARNTNIDEAMQVLIAKILEVAKDNVPERPEGTVELGSASGAGDPGFPDPPPKAKSGCCE